MKRIVTENIDFQKFIFGGVIRPPDPPPPPPPLGTGLAWILTTRCATADAQIYLFLVLHVLTCNFVDNLLTLAAL